MCFRSKTQTDTHQRPTTIRHHVVERDQFLAHQITSNETILQTVDKIKNISQRPKKRTLDLADYVRYRTNSCGCAYQPVHKNRSVPWKCGVPYS